ncbi:50S ribosomal protein L18 [bacterium K02(2017)]|nr:50S ribosomal protein L18 [bacterium K02(2017)]
MAFKSYTDKEKRKRRVRKKISGTTERPRLSVFRSNRYLYAQIIDDSTMKTLVSGNTLKDNKGSNKSSAAALGKLVGDKAIEQKIDSVIFDRGCNKYHGVIKELADGARETGLKF